MACAILTLLYVMVVNYLRLTINILRYVRVTNLHPVRGGLRARARLRSHRLLHLNPSDIHRHT